MSPRLESDIWILYPQLKKMAKVMKFWIGIEVDKNEGENYTLFKSTFK